MNLYVVVEGEGEAQVYRKWIPLVNPSLTYVVGVDCVRDNHFAIISGGGYPFYNRVILNAIDDVNQSGRVDRLVVAVDSHEMDKTEKYREIAELVQDKDCKAEVCIIVQHFCLETWALGNQEFPRRNTTNPQLRLYQRFFNIIEQDPELLPDYPLAELTRAQFAAEYLRVIISDRQPRLSYHKTKPTALLESSYFYQVKSRLHHTGHIASFQGFLDAFSG